MANKELEDLVGQGARIAMRAKDAQFKTREVPEEGGDWWEHDTSNPRPTGPKTDIRERMKTDLRKFVPLTKGPWWRRAIDRLKKLYYTRYPERYPLNRGNAWLQSLKEIPYSTCRVCDGYAKDHKIFKLDDTYPVLFTSTMQHEDDEYPVACWVYPDLPWKYRRQPWYKNYQRKIGDKVQPC